MAAISAKTYSERLPFEEICSYLDVEDRCGVAPASKEMRQVVLKALEAQVRENRRADLRTLTEYGIRLGDFPQLTLSESTMRVLGISPQGMRKSLLEKIFSANPGSAPTISSIETLDLSSSTISDAELVFLLNNLPHLQHLKIGNCQHLTRTALLAIASCEKLLSLEAVATCMTDEILAAIIRGCPHLKSLNLTSCFHLTNSGLELIASCAHLEWLSVGQAHSPLVDATLLKIIRACTHLRFLDLSWCTKLTKDIFAAIAERTDLECLKAELTQISDQALSVITVRCPYLRSLDLGTCKQLTEKGWEAIANCKRLEFLNARSTEISDEALWGIANNCPQLRSLSLANCKKIKQEGVKAIAKIGKQLDHLDLSVNLIGDGEFLSIINECEPLRSLKLSKCPNLTAGLEAVARCHHLRSLTATDSKISGKALLAIVQNCPYLESLDLSDSKEIKAHEFAAIHHPNLVDLDLRGTSINNQALVEIILNCPNLRRLTLYNCENLTLADDVLALIQKRCPTLKIVGDTDREESD